MGIPAPVDTSTSYIYIIDAAQGISQKREWEDCKNQRTGKSAVNFRNG